jgi:hypothetical protein
MFQTPILLLLFNRLDTTKQVLEMLRVIKPKYLYVAADGPRENCIEDRGRCNDLRNWVLSNVDWICEVKTLFQEKNLGCGRGPVTGITWFFNQVEEGIILEDDCVPDLSFFYFCENLLEYYRNSNRISIISGVNFDSENLCFKGDDSYFYSAFPFTWGWATWRKNWVDYDFEIKRWGVINKKELLQYLFENKGYQKAWAQLFEKIYKMPPTDIWDFQFFFSCFLKRQYSIVPKNNLVTNIGVGINATHTIGTDGLLTNNSTKPIEKELIHPVNFIRNFKYDIFLQEINYGKVEVLSLQKVIKRWIRKNIYKI